MEVNRLNQQKSKPNGLFTMHMMVFIIATLKSVPWTLDERPGAIF